MEPSASRAVLAERTAIVRARALELGFDKVGFAPAGPADPDGHFRRWLETGCAGELDYMAEQADARSDPRLYVRGARSVIALATSYYRPEVQPSGPLKISRYAVGDDYHGILRRKVRKLRRTILQLDPGATVGPSVDSSPVLERTWAARAGIAWIGKSTMAIAPDLGTYTFLATLVTTTEFIYDEPHPDRCGSCTRCLDACPTQAFDGPHRLDARRCITYWNVEVRREPDPDAPDLHGWVAGCDVCQEVCPWNKFARPAREPRFAPRPELHAPDRATFTNVEALRTAIAGTALQRTGPEALQRNARRILGEVLGEGSQGEATEAGEGRAEGEVPADERSGA